MLLLPLRVDAAEQRPYADDGRRTAPLPLPPPRSPPVLDMECAEHASDAPPLCCWGQASEQPPALAAPGKEA